MGAGHSCEMCEAEPKWVVYAAYDIDSRDEVHPRLARYPSAMYRACDDHLGPVMRKDSTHLATTAQWVVKTAELLKR